jgi:hypothetical protein
MTKFARMVRVLNISKFLHLFIIFIGRIQERFALNFRRTKDALLSRFKLVWQYCFVDEN